MLVFVGLRLCVLVLMDLLVLVVGLVLAACACACGWWCVGRGLLCHSMMTTVLNVCGYLIYNIYMRVYVCVQHVYACVCSSSTGVVLLNMNWTRCGYVCVCVCFRMYVCIYLP